MTGYGNSQSLPPTGVERAKFRLAELEMVDQTYLSKSERKAIRKEKRQMIRIIDRTARRTINRTSPYSGWQYTQRTNTVYTPAGGYCD